MAPKPFKSPPQAPPLFTATPSSILENTKSIIDRSRKMQDKIVAEVTPEQAVFDNVMGPMIYDDNSAALETHILGFYQAVSSNQGLRDASTEADKLLDNFSIESAMREDVFKLVDAVVKKGESLEGESQRLLEKEYKHLIELGMNIPAGPQRDRFKAIKERLSTISITFQKFLNEEKGGLWFSPTELDGVPGDVLATFKKGEGENQGKLRLTFKYPDYLPTLKYCTNSATRKQVFIANENKCLQNVPLFKEAILLRDEAARMLGYPNHAALMIEDKMAKTVKTVNDFLGDLRQRLTEGGKEEVATFKKLKESDLKSRQVETAYDGRYYLWDNGFYNRLLLETEYSVDQQKVSEYFPLQSSISGMLKIFEDLLGLEFNQIQGEDLSRLSPTGKGEDIVWHEEVLMFSVWDDEGEGGGFVGYLYLDLHPREGKYGHAANFNIQPGFIQENGTRHYPATSLVCNLSKPTREKPSLLKHDEVVTLFHELGHGIHDLVSRTKYARFHGTHTVQDFVEAPSQMLENWCWTPSQLKSLSQHYSTLSPEYLSTWQKSNPSQSTPPEKIPDDLIANIVRTKSVTQGALHNLRQLHFGIYDMQVHTPSSHAALEDSDVTVLYNRLRKEITTLDGPETLGQGFDWGHGQSAFGHLIGGYDAGYYGYLSSQVYSADMFYSVFKKAPMDPKEGRRYRYTVLEPGGSRDEMENLEAFLGRKPNTDAFYKDLGIA